MTPNEDISDPADYYHIAGEVQNHLTNMGSEEKSKLNYTCRSLRGQRERTINPLLVFEAVLNSPQSLKRSRMRVHLLGPPYHRVILCWSGCCRDRGGGAVLGSDDCVVGGRR